jgi:CheY-like chemotaxis protein
MEPRAVRVLVAEDNPFISDLVRQGLSHSVRRRVEGQITFAFDSALDGQEALAKLSGGGFDLLICDMMMPMIDGAEVIRHLRASEALRGIKVLAMSAAGPEAEEKALEAGADFFLDKPIVLNTLTEAIIALLGL